MSDELETPPEDSIPEPPDVSGGQETPPETPPSPEQKPDELRAAMTELAGTVSRLATAGHAEPGAKPPTPDEIAEMWAIYNPEKNSKDFFRKFFRFDENTPPEQVEEAKGLFVQMHEGMMRQAMQGARNFISIEMERMKQEFGPVREYVEESRREATRSRFHDTYPGLGEPKFNKIVESVARTLDNKTFTNEDAYFKELAEGSATAIKEILPDFDLGKPAETKTKPGQTPRLPRTSAGGGGGAGKGRQDVLQPTGSRNDIDALEFETP